MAPIERCCKEIGLFIDDSRDPIEYDPVYRMYLIRFESYGNIIWFSYCPFCGSKLPKHLKDEWWDILYEMGYEPFDDKDSGKIPEEFKSDEWWKKRGL